MTCDTDFITGVQAELFSTIETPDDVIASSLFVTAACGVAMLVATGLIAIGFTLGKLL